MRLLNLVVIHLLIKEIFNLRWTVWRGTRKKGKGNRGE
jgi:hypothetical protein